MYPSWKFAPLLEICTAKYVPLQEICTPKYVPLLEICAPNETSQVVRILLNFDTNIAPCGTTWSWVNLVNPILMLVAGVIGNLASPVFGTPTQNSLAILEPPSKIRWGILSPCGASLGEFGIPVYRKSESWRTMQCRSKFGGTVRRSVKDNELRRSADLEAVNFSATL